MTKSADEFLEELRQRASSLSNQGAEFERLVQACLSVAPTYRRQYGKVWRWGEWARHQGISQADTGIDLVAETRDGRYCAIQCKFFQPGNPVSKSAIDSFLAAANEHWGADGEISFSEMILVSAGEELTKHANNSLRKQRIKGIYLPFSELTAELPEDVDWDELLRSRAYKSLGRKLYKDKAKTLRAHQERALKDVLEGFKKSDRGKLIMACGTGKTLLSVKIAERLLRGKGGNVLFLAPSLALVSQSLHEWSADFSPDARFFAVCSDVKVGREAEDISVHELAIPATTDSDQLAKLLHHPRSNGKRPIDVVFATYHSINVISEAQEKGAPDFALVICDEAHRTTGVEQTASGNQRARSYFTQVHDQGRLRADKRLYMTATPRIYTESAKQRGKERDADVYSMDDPEIYGEEFHRLDFSSAVEQGLLSDYRVLILGVDEKQVSDAMQELFSENGEINLDDTAKIIGCWNGLAKRIQNTEEFKLLDSNPMRRAVAFSQTIAASKHIKEHFTTIVEQYQKKYPGEGLDCEIEHVDGTQGAAERNRHLQWLRKGPGQGGCRILSNVRCLSEGVDVPALDAVLFLNPRRSIVDIVQSVGRVMRKAPDKKYGYIILPVAVPANVSPEEALGGDDSRYAVVWQVLQALRAHDDQFNAEINRIELNQGRSEKVVVSMVGGVEEEGATYTPETQAEQLRQGLLNLEVEEWRNAIFAKMVLKCGDRRYWEDWAKDVANIAQRNITRIKTLVQGSKSEYRELFGEFLTELRQNLNPEVSEDDAIEMLSQHLITKPVFSALFENYDFANKNPVSKTMQAMLDLLYAQNLDTETRSLEGFYESVRQRASGIDNAEGRQRVVIELYEKFFRTAFPKMAESLGIVYTPIEVVDFILHSVDWLLRKEFGKRIGAAGVNVLDPFTGTGTFISRLLQSSSLIQDEDLKRKFSKELWANELVLLAYYIAAINIEEAYHGRKQEMEQRKKEGNLTYEPFEGIVLTDTFQINERDGDMLDKIFPVNSKRVQKQKKTPIRVVLGNPPYSAGQKSANDQNANLKYEKLDGSIEDTYAYHSSGTNKRHLYDSYIRAFRWASDRIGDEGIVAYVSNGGWLDGNVMDGFRQCLQEEFSSIYCFNLRGNARTSGEQRRKEKDNVFGQGTRTGVVVSFLVKTSQAKQDCQIYYHDIGDYLNRERKLETIQEFGNAEKIPWDVITPNEQHDWINQRNPEFIHWLPLGDKKNTRKKIAVSSVFTLFNNGVATNRDAWTYNFSRKALTQNMESMIEFYNQEVDRYKPICESKGVKEPTKISDFINNDPTKISWSRGLKAHLQRIVKEEFLARNIRDGLYRPFTKQHLYIDNIFTEFPAVASQFSLQKSTKNLTICVSGVSASKEFSALMVNVIPNLHFLDSSQCFPRYSYLEKDKSELLGEEGQVEQMDNIPPGTVTLFQNHYNDQTIDADAIFYYVYGVLHSPEYKKQFSADLKKMLPRIPYVKGVEDFWTFSKAGRELADLHVGYEQLEPYPLKIQEKIADGDLSKRYKVRKMRFGGAARTPDKSVIHYNDNVTIEDIPLEAYDYIVNGKSAVEWIMDRYQVTTHKESKITNDPNDWSDDPRYIVNLLGKVVHLSIETVKIVNALPKIL